MATDMRMLAHDKEMEEPFEKNQVGSTAMPWKRNPMRSERACSLSRIPLAMNLVTQITGSIQLLERSLDDSAARRIAIAEAFLATDAILRIMQNVAEGLVVYPAVIRRHIDEELPFMAIEKIIVRMVEAGASRQECHERLRQHSQAAAAVFKEEGNDNDLLDRIRQDEYFAPVRNQLDSLLNPDDFVGRAPQQVEEFLADEVTPALEPYREMLAGSAELVV
jgi:adenylosuccinate lyase